MRFGVVVFPGSNCDHDALYAVSHNLGHQADFIWHDSTSIGHSDAVILPGGAGGGGTAGDFIANLGIPDLHYTTSLQEMGGAMCVAALESAATTMGSATMARERPNAGTRRRPWADG